MRITVLINGRVKTLSLNRVVSAVERNMTASTSGSGRVITIRCVIVAVINAHVDVTMYRPQKVPANYSCSHYIRLE